MSDAGTMGGGPPSHVAHSIVETACAAASLQAVGVSGGAEVSGIRGRQEPGHLVERDDALETPYVIPAEDRQQSISLAPPLEKHVHPMIGMRVGPKRTRERVHRAVAGCRVA